MEQVIIEYDIAIRTLGKGGEKYFACVSRVSDEFIISYEETLHRVVQRLVDDLLVAGAALYVGVVGCTKYEDEPL